MIYNVTLKDIYLDIKLPDHDPEKPVKGTLNLTMRVGHKLVIDSIERAEFLTPDPTGKPITQSWDLGPQHHEQILDKYYENIVDELFAIMHEVEAEYREHQRLMEEEMMREQSRKK